MLKADSLVTTYLEMRSPVQLRPKRNAAFKIHERTERDWRFNRDMYFRVGELWRWIDKLPWTDQEWNDYATDPSLRTFAASYENKLAGYYELHRSMDRGQKTENREQQFEVENVEIAYFGLLPDFIGSGFGGALLTSAIENAWAWRPTPSRVWVHTCNRDHPNALANYQARGFEIYRVEREAPQF